MGINWQTKKIGEIIVENKKSSLKSKGNISGTYPFFVSGFKIKSIDRYLVDKENIFLPTGGNFFVHYFNGKASYSTDTWAIKTNDDVLIKYFYYFIFLKQDLISNKMFKGATIKHLQKDDFKNIDILFPSLQEQKRIVEILDKTFEKLKKVKENTEKNLQNSKEFFISYLENVFEHKNKKINLVKLAELATDITDGDHMPPPKSQTGIPFITISDIDKDTNKIDFKNTFNVSMEYYTKLKDNRKPKLGDVLYTVTGSFGIPVIVDSDFKFCFQRHIGLVRPNTNTDSRWLYYLIMSPQVLKQGKIGATGTAQKTVSLGVLRNFLVPKISLPEQKLVVKKLDQLSEQTKKLESIYQKKLDDIEELKKSILNKAFTGKL